MKLAPKISGRCTFVMTGRFVTAAGLQITFFYSKSSSCKVIVRTKMRIKKHVPTSKIFFEGDKKIKGSSSNKLELC